MAGLSFRCLLIVETLNGGRGVDVRGLTIGLFHTLTTVKEDRMVDYSIYMPAKNAKSLKPLLEVRGE